MAKRKSKTPERRWWSFEHRSDELATRSTFIRRMLGSAGMALGLILVSLIVGMVGYHSLAGLNFVDSLLESSMILGGMGPVNELHSDGAKIFASIYALYSGLLVLALMGIVLTPIVHRVMHKFHVEDKDDE